MTPNNKRAIVAATISGALLRAYSKEERTRTHEDLLIRVGKGIHNEVKKYGKVAEDAITVGNNIWIEAMDKFKHVHIEASYFIIELSLKDNKILSKRYGLSDGIIAKWAKASRHKDARQIEINTRDVCAFIFSRLNEEFGIHEEKVSLFERLGRTA